MPQLSASDLLQATQIDIQQRIDKLNGDLTVAQDHANTIQAEIDDLKSSLTTYTDALSTLNIPIIKAP